MISSNPDVASILQSLAPPGKILVSEHSRHGDKAIYHVESMVTSDERYDFKITLGALMLMGTRIYGRLPARKRPPVDNKRPS